MRICDSIGHQSVRGALVEELVIMNGCLVVSWKSMMLSSLALYLQLRVLHIVIRGLQYYAITSILLIAVIVSGRFVVAVRFFKGANMDGVIDGLLGLSSLRNINSIEL